MKQRQQLSGICIGGAAIALSVQSVCVAATSVTAVRLNPNQSSFEVILETPAGNPSDSTLRPKIFTVSRGNELITDVSNSQLQLGKGNSFRQDKPLPGIASVVVSQLDANSIRVSVTGENSAPSGDILLAQEKDITLSFSPTAKNQAAQKRDQVAPTSIAQVPPATPPIAVPPILPSQTPQILPPNPDFTILGNPAPAAGAVQPVLPAPPFLPRAIAPPVGDMTVSNIDSSPSFIDLGTAARIPKLLLRDAPVRDVLSLLARSAGLNLAFTTATGSAQGAAAGQTTQAASTITLDIENEPVQDVFNYVLQISGLQANRLGRTIFVGPELPQGIRDLITRTFRLNQVTAAVAANFLAAQGAESRTVGTASAAPTAGRGPLLLTGMSVVNDDRLNAITLIGSPRQMQIATSFLTQLDARRRQVAVNVKIIDVNLLNTDNVNSSFSFGVGNGFFAVDGGAAAFNFGGFRPPTAGQVSASPVSPPVITNPFAGASVFLDPNNSITIPGTAPGTTIINAAGGTVTRTGQGAATFYNPFVRLNNPLQPGFTTITPATNDIVTIAADGTVTTSPGTLGTVTTSLPSLLQFPTKFLASLQAQITSGNAKILTDPTLMVQEGERSTVNLSQEVFGGFQLVTQAVPNSNLTSQVQQPIIKQAGLLLDVLVSRIDDNGFVTLSVNPTVSAPASSQATAQGNITLVQQRQLQSGQIRLRDGQTLILSGIIQQSDRTTVSKVPILGDIPILGALFRSTNRVNQRNEVIVLLTPQILDDSGRSSFGYNYNPGPDTRQILQRQGFPIQGGNQ